MSKLDQHIEQPAAADKNDISLFSSSPTNLNEIHFPISPHTTSDHTCTCTQHYHNITASILQPYKKRTNFHHHHHPSSVASCTLNAVTENTAFEPAAQHSPSTSRHVCEISNEPNRLSLSLDDSSSTIMTMTTKTTTANLNTITNIMSQQNVDELSSCVECNGNGCSVCIDEIHHDQQHHQQHHLHHHRYHHHEQHSENSSKLVSTDENNSEDNNFSKSSNRLNK